MACPSQAQAFNPDANHDGQVGAGDVLAVLAVYGLPFSATIAGPSILHFDPDTIGVLPLGYDLYIAENFTFPYLYVTVPDGEYPGQSFKLAVEKQADMDDQQVYLQDTSGNWLTNARQYETNGFYAELVWTGIRWVSRSPRMNFCAIYSPRPLSIFNILPQLRRPARMVELVDTTDLKSVGP